MDILKSLIEYALARAVQYGSFPNLFSLNVYSLLPVEFLHLVTQLGEMNRMQELQGVSENITVRYSLKGGILIEQFQAVTSAEH